MTTKPKNRVMLYITYIAFLALVVVQFERIEGVLLTGLAIFSPFFLGFAMAFVLAQPYDFFYKIIKNGNVFARHASPLAVTLAYTSVIIVVTSLTSFVVPKLVESITDFLNSLEGYIANLQVWVYNIRDKLDIEFINGLDFSNLNQYLEQVLQNTLKTISGAASQVISMTGSLVSAIVNFVMAFVFSVYMLAGKDDLCQKATRVARAYLPKKTSARLIEVCSLSNRIFSKFLAGQLIEACILGTLCGLGMLLIMADYAMLIGILVGVSALVPVVGGYVGGGLAFLLLFLVSPMKAVIFLVFLLLLQQFEGNIIYPRVVGGSVGLPGLWVLLAVIVGSGLFGITGALLGVPTVSVLYALLKQDVLQRETNS